MKRLPTHPTTVDMTEAVRALGLARVARQKEWWLPETTDKRKQDLQTAVDIARIRLDWIADRTILSEIEAAEELDARTAQLVKDRPQVTKPDPGPPTIG